MNMKKIILCLSLFSGAALASEDGSEKINDYYPGGSFVCKAKSSLFGGGNRYFGRGPNRGIAADRALFECRQVSRVPSVCRVTDCFYEGDDGYGRGGHDDGRGRGGYDDGRGRGGYDDGRGRYDDRRDRNGRGERS